MSDEERALSWVEKMAHLGRDGDELVEICRTLTAILARPVMPEELPEEAIPAMWEAGKAAASPVFVRTPPNDTMRRVFRAEYRALREHLTAPKTKEVEVERWIVVYPGSDHTSSADFHCEASAKAHAGTIGIVVKLTGKATVPA